MTGNSFLLETTLKMHLCSLYETLLKGCCIVLKRINYLGKKKLKKSKLKKKPYQKGTLIISSICSANLKIKAHQLFREVAIHRNTIVT